MQPWAAREPSASSSCQEGHISAASLTARSRAAAWSLTGSFPNLRNSAASWVRMPFRTSMERCSKGTCAKAPITAGSWAGRYGESDDGDESLEVVHRSWATRGGNPLRASSHEDNDTIRATSIVCMASMLSHCGSGSTMTGSESSEVCSCSCSCESDLSFLDSSRWKKPPPCESFFASLGMEPTRSRMPRASMSLAPVSDGAEAPSGAGAVRALR